MPDIKMLTLLCLKQLLKPAVDIMKDINAPDDEAFIYQGYLALDTLSLHKSIPFIRKLFQTVLK